jgi:hypothetical protein
MRGQSVWLGTIRVINPFPSRVNQEFDVTNRIAIVALSVAAILGASQVAYARGLGSFRSSGIPNARMYSHNGGSDPFRNSVRSGTSRTSTTTGEAGRAGLMLGSH